MNSLIVKNTKNPAYDINLVDVSLTDLTEKSNEMTTVFYFRF